MVLLKGCVGLVSPGTGLEVQFPLLELLLYCNPREWESNLCPSASTGLQVQLTTPRLTASDGKGLTVHAPSLSDGT